MSGELDRPEILPEQQSAVDEAEAKRRAEVAAEIDRLHNDFLRFSLADETGRRFLWSILKHLGTFEEKYGFGPYGHLNSEATWAYRGQKDAGLQLFNDWLARDPVGMVKLLQEFHPRHPTPKEQAAPPSERGKAKRVAPDDRS